MIPQMPISKTADLAVLREKPAISPGKVSASGRTLPRIYKKILSSDTKPAILRELRKGNLSSKSNGRKEQSADRSISKRTGAEQAPTRNRGRRFEITHHAR